MKNLILGLSILMSSAGFTAAAEDSNVFKAELSNPDLALAVTAFEQACLQFVLHKTEMTPDLDRQHTADILESRDFELTSSEVKSYNMGGLRWKPKESALNTKGQFTVFSDFSNQVVQSMETILSQTGEISGPSFIKPEYISVTVERATYTLRSDDRLTANLTLFTPSQNPGKSCEIRLDQPKIDAASFAADFIDKDADWLLKNNGWTQCITEGEDQFRFEVFRTPQTLAISMIRNDFYTPKLCK